MPLSVEQRRQLERRLLEERERATTELGRLGRRFARRSRTPTATSRTSAPPADQGTDEFDRQFDSAAETRVSRELAEIDAALERLLRGPGAVRPRRAHGRRDPVRAARADPVGAAARRRASRTMTATRGRGTTARPHPRDRPTRWSNAGGEWQPEAARLPPVLVPDRPHPGATAIVIAAWLLQLLATR
jgi:RNA polymerase-binding transcription factor DksA